jgi:hypothetical protein
MPRGFPSCSVAIGATVASEHAPHLHEQEPGRRGAGVQSVPRRAASLHEVVRVR